MSTPAFDPDAISYEACVQAIQSFATRIEASANIMPMASALGVYVQKLQAEHNYAPVFPLDLLPVPKEELKKWACRYAALTVGNTGKLARFQQDGALCFTRFQPMTEKQWDAIRTDTIPDLVKYNAEMRDKGSSDAHIPADIKAIIDAYRREYKEEETALHSQLRTSSPTRAGCAGNATALVAAIAAIAWWLLR